jgi:hypothetical protein
MKTGFQENTSWSLSIKTGAEQIAENSGGCAEQSNAPGQAIFFLALTRAEDRCSIRCFETYA